MDKILGLQDTPKAFYTGIKAKREKKARFTSACVRGASVKGSSISSTFNPPWSLSNHQALGAINKCY